MGDSIAERLPGSSNINFRHVFGPGTDEPIVWYVGSGTSDRRFLNADERGSIVAVTDSSANLLAINRYDEYGRTQTSGINFGRFLYTGQRWFGAIGLYYYKNRFYHPDAGGRFLQPDPIGYGSGMNLYAYVGGDPVNFTDPLGLKKCDRHTDDGAPVVCGKEPELVIAGAAAALGNHGGYDPRPTGEGGMINADADGDGQPDPDIVITRDDEEEIIVQADQNGALAYLARLAPLREALKKILTRSPNAAGKAKIQWGFRGHSDRRLRAAGINPAKAQRRVQSILDRMAGRARPGDWFGGSFKVDGKWVGWRAQVMPDGSINVGTIHPLF